VTGGKPIVVILQSISGVTAINPLVAFYDIHGGKREVLFFYFFPDTTRDIFLMTRHIIYSLRFISEGVPETSIYISRSRILQKRISYEYLKRYLPVTLTAMENSVAVIYV
jgi:hypothetical protein